ncbi:MAG: cobalt-precorrin-5B (C(1))-methyltransferase, partial [Aestuariivirgaceae bacterium]
ALAEGIEHIAGATGSTSEASVQAFHSLPNQALIDMGDFVGGMLKYVRGHPVPKVTVAGGFGKMTKMAQGAMDLHSGRSQVDFDWLARRVELLDGDPAMVDQVRAANTAKQAYELARSADIDLASDIANNAMEAGYRVLRGSDVELDIVVIDRDGAIIGRAS